MHSPFITLPQTPKALRRQVDGEFVGTDRQSDDVCRLNGKVLAPVRAADAVWIARLAFRDDQGRHRAVRSPGVRSVPGCVDHGRKETR